MLKNYYLCNKIFTFRFFFSSKWQALKLKLLKLFPRSFSKTYLPKASTSRLFRLAPIKHYTPNFKTQFLINLTLSQKAFALLNNLIQTYWFFLMPLFVTFLQLLFSIIKNGIFFIYTIFFLTKKNFGEGFVFLRGLALVFCIDAMITDDEPLWEPLEWSLIQTWIFFIFFFAWIAENLITSRFGSYTGRDKKIWNAWYRTFWLIELWFLISYFSAILFVIIPFYYEITYLTAFIVSWWNWYSKIFFFKFISIYALILLLANYLLLNLQIFNWKKLFFLSLIIFFFLTINFFFQFLILFFGYFSDPLWYQQTRYADFIQLSHEPLKWGWGTDKRDHFTYHNVATVFWFKNDIPFIGAMFLMHSFFFLSWFFVYLYWLILIRRIYTTCEISYTLTTYCVSALKQNFYYCLLIYGFIGFSFLVNYWRLPIEFFWYLNLTSWNSNFIIIMLEFFFTFNCYLLKLQKF